MRVTNWNWNSRDETLTRGRTSKNIMGYFRYTLKCTKCEAQWASFFTSYDMSYGQHDCPQCGTKDEKDEHGVGPIVKVADAWEFTKIDENGKETDETYWH